MQMERERVVRKRKLHNRKAFRESSLSGYSPASTPRKKPRLQKAEENTEEQYFPIKSITAESRGRDGKLQYMIDWEDDPHTGESYSQSWQRAENVNLEAIRDWERQKREARVQATKSPLPESDEEASLELDDSQPIRTAKRKRRIHVTSSSGQSPRTIECHEEYSPKREIKDSYEEKIPNDNLKSVLQIIIRPLENFDPSEYHFVASSQPSQPSQQRESSQPPDSSLSQSQSRSRPQKKSLSRKLFLWDEDIEVADSQELPNSDSYKPSNNQASEPRTDTETNIYADPIQSTYQTSSPGESRQLDPGFVESSEAALIQSTYQASFGDNTRESVSKAGIAEFSYYSSTTNNHEALRRVTEKRSAGASTTESLTFETVVPEENRIASSKHRAGENARQHDTCSRQSGDSKLSNIAFGETVTPDYSSAQPTASAPSVISLPRDYPDPAPVVAHIAGSEDANPLPHQEESIPDRQPDYPNTPSSCPFQTQLPSFGGEGEGIEEHIVETKSLERNHTFQHSSGTAAPAAPLLEIRNSQTSRSESPRSRFVPSVEKLTSSLEDTWQTARGVSLPPRTSEASLESRFAELPRTLQTIRRESGKESIEGASLIHQSPRTPTRTQHTDFDMDPSSIDGTPIMDTKQLMKQARANASAKRAAEAASREASTMPPSPSVAMPDHMLPLRETVTEPTIPIIEPAFSPKSSPETELDSKALRIVPLGPDEYVVALPMQSQTRDMYVQTLANNKRRRLEFLSDDIPNESVVKDIDLMMDHLARLCDHQALIDDDSSTQLDLPSEIQARYAETVSTKCIYFADFIEAIKLAPKRIAILASPGKMQEILEAVLGHHGFQRVSDASDNFRNPKGLATISLRSTTEEFKTAQPTDATIAFASLHMARPYATSTGALISLVVTHSIEHIDLCFENDNTVERKQMLVDCITQIQDQVGILNSEFPNPTEAAKETARFLTNAVDNSWPLESMPEIHGLEFAMPPQLTQSRSDNLASCIADSDGSPAQALQAGVKRQLDGLNKDDISSDSLKRQRTSPPLSSIAGSRNTRHISDTIFPSSEEQISSVEDATTQVAALITEMNALKVQRERDASEINELRGQLEQKKASEAELRDRNRRLEIQCKDYESGIKEVQPKYQEALNDRGHFEYEINNTLRQLSTLRKKHEDLIAELGQTREKNEASSAELIAARAQLTSSALPEVAEMEKTREELRITKVEVERRQRKIDNMQNETDFLRDEYRKTSSAYGEILQTVSELNEELVEFREKASANRIILQEAYINSEVSQHLQRIKELTAEKVALEQELDRKTEELKNAAMNGRRGTRGQSQPRSPRMANASPRQPMSRVLAGNGPGSRSRGNSPAPGEPIGARMAEALFQGPPGRWGNHLQG